MRILFVAHGFPPQSVGGTELCTYYLAKELNKRHEVYVFHRRADPSQEEYAIEDYMFDGLRVTSINNNFRNVTDFSMTYKNDVIAAKFSSFLERVKPDVVHFQHLTCLSTSLIHVCHEKRIPTVFTLHDYWMLCQRGQLLKPDLSICPGPSDRECADCLSVQISSLSGSLSRNRFLQSTIENRHTLLGNVVKGMAQLYAQLDVKLNQRRAVKLIRDRTRHVHQMLREVDLLITPSRFHREQFIKFGVPKDKIIFSDNGMNTRLFEGFQKTKSDKIRFGFIGTIIPSKGLHVLIEAFNMVESDKATLSIYGIALPYDGYENYPQELQGMAVNPNIEFMGGYDNEDIANILSGIDVLIVPSIWYENSPLTIHEAFMAGIPVIASNIGGMAEYVHHMENGLLFEVGNPADLCDKISTVIENQSLIETLSKNIRPVKTIEESATELEGIYEQLIQAKKLKECKYKDLERQNSN